MTGRRCDEATLEAWGRAIGRTVARPAVLALEGALGAGKSTLARSVARGAGVEGAVPSPTYNLVLEYETPDLGPFVHVDLYRLDAQEDVVALGWEELLDGDGLVVIEWPERAQGLLPPDRWRIALSVDPAFPYHRDIVAQPVGSPPALPAFVESVL
jgi:tRNA threonylcarbamoyladenosine biosynthesis protein TsaE